MLITVNNIIIIINCINVVETTYKYPHQLD